MKATNPASIQAEKNLASGDFSPHLFSWAWSAAFNIANAASFGSSGLGGWGEEQLPFSPGLALRHSAGYCSLSPSVHCVSAHIVHLILLQWGRTESWSINVKLRKIWRKTIFELAAHCWGCLTYGMLIYLYSYIINILGNENYLTVRASDGSVMDLLFWSWKRFVQNLEEVQTCRLKQSFAVLLQSKWSK